MRYEPRLDGIRGIAVLLVFTFHATGALPGGWVGVDIFFVLSGYLITTILSREVDRTGTIDLRNFYARRVLRLAPALVLAVALSVPLMLAFHADQSYPLWGVALGVLGYAGNWMQVAIPTSLGPLSHTWTLAIEEQFYLVWPLVLLVVAASRATRKRRIGWILTATAALIASRVALMVAVSPEAAWFATTSRADALLIGAALAMLAPSCSSRPATVLLVGCATVILVIARIGQEFSTVMLVGGLTVAALAATGLIVGVQASPLGRAFEWMPLVAVGRVSYGIYLFHYPVFYLSNQLEYTGLLAWAVKLLGTAALVVVSWYCVEQPALRLKRRLPMSRRDAARQHG